MKLLLIKFVFKSSCEVRPSHLIILHHDGLFAYGSPFTSQALINELIWAAESSCGFSFHLFRFAFFFFFFFVSTTHPTSCYSYRCEQAQRRFTQRPNWQVSLKPSPGKWSRCFFDWPCTLHPPAKVSQWVSNSSWMTLKGPSMQST